MHQAGQSGRNFVRGVRGEPAVRSDGQTTLGYGGSRAHAAGQRVNDAGSRLSNAFRDNDESGGGGSGGSGPSGGGGSGPSGDEGSSGGSSDSERSQRRNTSHDNLRDGANRRRIDDEPRYVQ